MRFPRRLGGPLGVMLLAGVAGSAGASAAESRRADLRPSAPGFTEPAGNATRVSVTIRNRGRARARASVVGVYLSADRRRGDGDVRLARLEISAVPAARRTTVEATPSIPSAVSPGEYWLIACADVLSRVHESSEANNCAPSRSRLRVATPSGDASAPTFAGLASATTCVPGPGEDRGATSRYRLEWAAAADDTTAPSAIAYDIYQSDAAGRQDLSAPTYTAPAGATVFSTPALPANRAWYFVVRARDGAGNRDANRTEVKGENICE